MVSSRDFGILALIGLISFGLLRGNSSGVSAFSNVPATQSSNIEALESADLEESEKTADFFDPITRLLQTQANTLARRKKLFPLSFKRRATGGELNFLRLSKLRQLTRGQDDKIRINLINQGDPNFLKLLDSL